MVENPVIPENYEYACTMKIGEARTRVLVAHTVGPEIEFNVIECPEKPGYVIGITTATNLEALYRYTAIVFEICHPKKTTSS
jgi:hypothetical protein